MSDYAIFVVGTGGKEGYGQRTQGTAQIAHRVDEADRPPPLFPADQVTSEGTAEGLQTAAGDRSE